jgi:hypothetical protein
MSSKKTRWSISKNPGVFTCYEKLEVPENYNKKFSADGTLDLDRNVNIEDSLLSNLFEDMSMSTNTGPPSYDVKSM